MKTFVFLAVSIVLVSILFCPMAMSAPSMPSDLEMVQPDPSLPKELSAFWGKWEGSGRMQYVLIVEKIDEEKANLYAWEWVSETLTPGWMRYEARVTKERGKYQLWYPGLYGNSQLMLKGEILDWSRWNPGTGRESVRLKRVQ